MNCTSRGTFLSEVDIKALSLLSAGQFIGDAFWICAVDQYRVVLDVVCKLVVVRLRCKEEDAIRTFLNASKLTLAINEVSPFAKLDDIEAAQGGGIPIWIA